MIGLLLSSIMTGSALAYGTATTSNGFTVNDWYSNSPQNGGSHLYHSSGNDRWKIVNGVETYQSHYSNTTIQRGKNNTIIAQSGRQWSSAKRATSNISYPNGNWGGYGWWGTWWQRFDHLNFFGYGEHFFHNQKFYVITTHSWKRVDRDGFVSHQAPLISLFP